MGMGGIIAGAFGGAAKAVGDVAHGYIENERKTDLARELSQIEEARQMRVMQAQETIRQGGHLWNTQGEGGKATLAFEDAKGKQASAQRVQEFKDTTGPAVERASLEQKARESAIREGVIARGTDPKFIAATRAITNASHYFGPQDQLAQAQLGKLKQEMDLRTKLSNETDPAKRETLLTQLNDLTGKTMSQRDLSTALLQTEQALAKARAQAGDVSLDEAVRMQAQESVDALSVVRQHLQRQLGGKGVAAGASDPILAALEAGREAKGKDKGAPVKRPVQGDRKQFEAMNNTQLEALAKAGNELAVEELDKRRRRGQAPVGVEANMDAGS